VLDLRTGGALPRAKRSIIVTGSPACSEWAGFGHAFHEVTGEVAVAGAPDPLTVGLAEGGPPLVGELP
jgi:hypothetical protein